ncbi:MAG: hypothetical protein AAF353_16495 [Pseudomonadota bacterium]
MISKIIITLAVIMTCMWVLSNRNTQSELREIPNPVVEKRKKHMRIAVFAFMAIMVIAASIMIYLELESRGG